MPRQTAHILAFLCSVCLCNITLFSNFASRFFFFPQKNFQLAAKKIFAVLIFPYWRCIISKEAEVAKWQTH